MWMYSDHMFRSLGMFQAGSGVGKKKNLCRTSTRPQAGVQRSTRYGGGTVSVGWGRGMKEDPGFWFGRAEVMAISAASHPPPSSSLPNSTCPCPHPPSLFAGAGQSLVQECLQSSSLEPACGLRSTCRVPPTPRPTHMHTGQPPPRMRWPASSPGDHSWGHLPPHPPSGSPAHCCPGNHQRWQ